MKLPFGWVGGNDLRWKLRKGRTGNTLYAKIHVTFIIWFEIEVTRTYNFSPVITHFLLYQQFVYLSYVLLFKHFILFTNETRSTEHDLQITS